MGHSFEEAQDADFEGEDTHSWVYRVERHFSINSLTDRMKLTAAAICLEGRALAWYQLREQPINT